MGEVPDRALSDAKLTAAGWVVGLVVTGLVLWSPLIAVGYRNPSLHLVLDSLDACVALLVAYLVYGRFRRDGRLQDVLLASGLVLLAVAGLVLSYAAELLGPAVAGTVDVWLPLTARVFGGLLIVASALAGDVPARRLLRRRPGTAIAAVVASVMMLAALALWAFRHHLPLAVDPTYVPASSDPALAGVHPLFLTGQTIAALSFFVASVAFTVQATRRRDELLRWLGPACALGAFARVNYALFPSLYTDWLYTGDFLRTACYVLLLVGALREMTLYWSAQARVAVLDDRRRLARELHDGVLQELSYIRAESHALPAGVAAVPRIIGACDRALDEARAAVNALGRVGVEPLGFMLHRAARELAERYRINLEVDLDDSVTADAEQKHALLRITREAVANAVRHGKAERVVVRLSQDDAGRRLVIQDDGAGFDVAAALAAPGGYGLTSMRDRARGLPGTFTVDAGSGAGSVVSITW